MLIQSPFTNHLPLLLISSSLWRSNSNNHVCLYVKGKVALELWSLWSKYTSTKKKLTHLMDSYWIALQWKSVFRSQQTTLQAMRHASLLTKQELSLKFTKHWKMFLMLPITLYYTFCLMIMEKLLSRILNIMTLQSIVQKKPSFML